MDPQHPQHQPLPRPSLFAASHDSRAAPPPRQYGPASSLHNGRSQPVYDRLGRRENETSRPPPYGYPSHSYAHEKPLSPVPFASLRNDAPNGFHTQPSSRGSLMKPGDGGLKDHGTLYREASGPPQPLARDMHPASQSHDQARRSSLGSSGSPVFASGPQEPPPSAPTSFGSRQMLPPSSPQHYQARGPPAAGPAPQPPSFSAREPPSNPAHRPGSSMSISSMLGSDSDRPSRDTGSTSIFSRPPATSSLLGSAPPPSALGAMSPPTAPARPTSLEYPLFGRSQTPDKPFSKNQPPRPYRSSSGSSSQLPVSEPPKFGGLSRPQTFSQYGEKPPTSQASPQISSAEAPYNESRRLSLNGQIQRPSSQPQHGEPSLRPPPRFSPPSRPSAGLADGVMQRAASAYPGVEAQQQRFNGLYGDRQVEEQTNREKERGPAHESDSKAPGPQAQSRYGSHFADREVERPQNAPAWETARSQPVSPETKRFPAPEPGSGFNFGAIQSYTKSLGSQLGASRPPPSISLQPRQGHPSPPPSEQPFLSSTISKFQSQQPRLFSPTSAPSTGQPSFGSSANDDQRRKGSDELMQQRNLLGVGNDGKRGGRASPLPQAVQGAQAQIIGPAGESGIKGELGRVFSGIGSGVGGVTAPPVSSGPPTPMAASPFKRDSANGRSTNGEATDDSKTGRTVPGPVRRSRKPKEEEGKVESENGVDQRAAAPGRAARRGRHVHHHHHHHHHHRHKTEEEASVAGGPHRTSASSMNLFHRTSTPSEGAAHHHHHHHHHHHVPRPAVNAPAPPPSREPTVYVNVEPVLKSVAHLPRHHLGSTVYAPRIGVPSPSAPLESAKFGYTTTPVPIPRFEGKENCTFTIRVPRFRIDASHREEICARRALWGTGIYTDDSDPVAAAIHSGFIRGEWGEDVDVSMLDLEIKDTYGHAPQPSDEAGTETKEGTEAQPRIPPVPPPDKDLHITLLILPRLERYESSVMFGLKSRAWDGTHDGMSFKVERIEWVDEGASRGEERSGEARRKRLRSMMQSGRICTGPGLLKLRQLRGGGAEPRRKMGMGIGENKGGSTVETVS